MKIIDNLKAELTGRRVPRINNTVMPMVASEILTPYIDDSSYVELLIKVN
jgi:hypothetical protein